MTAVLCNRPLGRRFAGSVYDRKWPGPDVRERQLFGVSMRTTGFRQGNRKLKNPQSTHSGPTGRGFRCAKAVLRNRQRWLHGSAREAILSFEPLGSRRHHLVTDGILNVPASTACSDSAGAEAGQASGPSALKRGAEPEMLPGDGVPAPAEAASVRIGAWQPESAKQTMPKRIFPMRRRFVRVMPPPSRLTEVGAA